MDASSGNVARLFFNQNLWNKAFKSDSKWEKDEILDILFWIRHLAAFVIGLVFGILKVKGFVGFIFYISIWFTVSQYFKLFLDLEEDDFGGWGSVHQEAAWSSFALFLFTWIVVYTAVMC
eukprot:ctg_8.g6